MADPVHKITIVARGRSLGHTLALPTHDKYLVRRSELVDQLAMLLGGRTAEELIFSDPTSGAANDIEKATQIARRMVMEFGMSDKLGPMQYGRAASEVFLGRDYGRQQDYSDEVAAFIDEEVRTMINAAHEEARVILAAHSGGDGANGGDPPREGDCGAGRGRPDLLRRPQVGARSRRQPADPSPVGACPRRARGGGRSGGRRGGGGRRERPRAASRG